MQKKLFILLPDGVGLKNFALTQFNAIGKEMGYEIVYWNNTPFKIKEELGYEELPIENNQINPWTTVYTRARKRCELNVFDKKFGETVYNTYNFPHSYKGVKNIIKSLNVDFLVATKSTEKGVDFIREKIKKLERTSPKYDYCKKQLQEHKPDLIFCTNPRPSQAIAPILAAQDLGIPTASFIFRGIICPKRQL